MKNPQFYVIDKKTGKEADTYKIALKEDWANHLCYCDMEGFAILEDGVLVLCDECGRMAYCPEDRFEIVFADMYVCSACGGLFYSRYNFCPRCGAKMEMQGG